MLQNRIRPVMIQLIILILIITSVSVYSISKEAEYSLKQSIQDKLISLANSTSAHINGDSFVKIQAGDETTSPYRDIRDFLQKTTDSAVNIKSIYTMRKNGTDIEFVVDTIFGATSGTADIGDTYDVYEAYQSVEPQLLIGFEKPIADEEFTIDQWGTTMSGFSPIKNSTGLVVGIVGVDMDASDVVAELNRLKVILYLLGLFAIISSIIGIVVIEGRWEKNDIHLRASESKYRYLFENAGDAILILAADTQNPGRIIGANETASQIHGYRSEELIGMHITQLKKSNDGTIVNERISHILQGEKIYVEDLHRKLDGSVFPVEISAGLIDTGKETYILDIIRDITKRKKAELAIEESEHRLRFALESIEAAEWDLNIADGTVIRSPDHDNLFGYESNIPEWTYEIFLSHIIPDDQTQVEQAFQSACEQGHKFTTECRINRRDGAVRWLSISGQPHIDNDGIPDRVVGLCFDCTRQKLMEEGIRRSLREKEILLHEIHHRVKNNMQIISSLISMQMRMIPEESVRGLLGESQSRVRSIALVYEQLSQSENMERIEYGPVLRRLYASLSELYTHHQNQISVTIDDCSTKISIIEAVPCTLIIRELLSNSMRHAFPDDRRGEISIKTRFDSERKEYTVLYLDNGVGIPEGLDLMTTRTVGMQLIFGLTKQLNGAIAFEHDAGVRCTITFPIDSKSGSSS